MQRLRTRLRASASTGAPPSLSLDFLGLNQTLDSRITFSRGSNATLVDSTGKVTYAPNNQVTYSQQFDIAWTQTSVTVSANSTSAPDGTTTADTVTASAATSAHRIFSAATTIPAGVNVIHSIYVKAGTHNFVQIHDGASGLYYANFNLSTGVVGTTANCTAAITALSGGWYRCSMAFANLAANPLLALGLVTSASAARNESWTAAGTESVYLWGAQIETVTYQTTPSTYNSTTASAYYGPRFDYDPVTLNPKGLLIEEQRSNLVTYSEQFDNAAWTKTLSSISANAAVSPDGTSNADTLVEAASAGTHWVGRAVSASASTAYTASIFVKAAGRTAGQFQIFGNGGGSTVSFNLSAGTSSAAGAYGGWASASTSITNFGNGWYRITNTATTNAGLTTLEYRVFLENPAGTPSYTGDGTSGLFIWGAQVEAGAFATSYIPTVASTVTRSADVATMTGTNFSSWYNQSEGTFAAEFDTTWTGVADATRYALAFDGSASKRIVYIGAGSNAASNYDGTNILNATGTITPGPSKIASAYGGATKQIVSNGGTVASGAFAGWASPVTLNIGSLGSSTNVVCGHIRRIAYYPTRLADYQLQGLTA